MFLHKSDYLGKIEAEDLDVVQGDRESIRLEAELESQAEIEGYLAMRFDNALIFIDLDIYDFAVTYTTGDLVIMDADAWESGKPYIADTLVEWEERIYKNISATSTQDPDDSTKWTEIAKQFDKFSSIGDSNTGNHVDDDTKWLPGDIRKLLIRRYMVDVSLYEMHSRLNPRQIPELRIQRRDDAISYLKKVADPRQNITPDLPLKVFADKEGNDISWNSNEKLQHGQDSY